MKPKPYIGVTGIKDLEETRVLLKGFEKAGISMDSSHIPMAGVLFSHEPKNSWKNDCRYPKQERLKGIFKALEGNALSTLHYDSKDRLGFAEKLCPVLKPLYENGLCDGLQINVHNPAKGPVMKLKSEFPEMSIILPVTRISLEGVTKKPDYEPRRVADYLRPYNEFIDYILIDPSLGKDGEISATNCATLYEQISADFPKVGTVIAGSFNPENVYPRVQELVEMIETNFSIDSQGGLRYSVKPKGVDLEYFKRHSYKYTLFAPERAESYLLNASRAFGSK